MNRRHIIALAVSALCAKAPAKTVTYDYGKTIPYLARLGLQKLYSNGRLIWSSKNGYAPGWGP